MRLERKIVLGMLLLLGIVLSSNFFLAYMVSNNQAFQYSKTGTTEFSKEMCQQGQDFLIQIAPLGCTPAVVRTDLLEESNVQVYCQLAATKINPLIDVEAIDSISFSGTYPKEISGIGFHPARSALGVSGDLNNPVLDNIGYVVINLKKQPNASAIPEVISGELTAKISYNIKGAFGIGKGLFYIPEFANDEEWEAKKYQYGFWNGMGYLKAEDVSNKGASISVYTDSGKISTVSLNAGETSGNVYIPGFECQAGLKLKLESLDAADTRAKLNINAETIEVAKGDKFLDNKCQATNLVSNGIVQKITLSCQEDKGKKTFDLTISPRIILDINGNKKEVGLGEKLYSTSDDKRVYLAYIGATGEAKVGNLFVYLVSLPSSQKKENENLTEAELSSISSLVRDLTRAEEGAASGLIEEGTDWLSKIGGWSSLAGRFIVSSQTFYRINFDDKRETAFGSQVSIIDFAGLQDREISGNKEEYYRKAAGDYGTIKESYSSISYGTTTYGEEALYKEIEAALKAEQKKTVLELCEDFSESYPESKNAIVKGICSNIYKLSSNNVGQVYLTINNQIKQVSFEGISEPSFKEYGVTIRVSTPKETRNIDLRKNQYKPEIGFSLQLISAEENSAKVQISVAGKKSKTELVTLEKGITNNFADEYSFTLTEVNLKRIARVSLLPNINNAGTQANFSFKVGIEKRAIDLSPEKIKQLIEKLDESMGRWQKISGVLGNVTKGLKTACLATGAALIVKNFLLNAGGVGMARQHVMRGANGWYERCKKDPKGLDACLNEHADDIDKEVGKVSKLMEDQDKWFEENQKNIMLPGVLSSSEVNTSALIDKYTPRVQDCLKSLPPESFSSTTGTNVDKNQILTTLSKEGWKNGVYTLSQLREIELFCEASKDADLTTFANANLYSNLLDVQTTAKDYAKALALSSQTGISSSKIGYLPIGKDVKKYDYLELKAGELDKKDALLSKNIAGVTAETPVYLAPASDGKTYLYVLSDTQKISQLSVKLDAEGIKQIYNYDTLALVPATDSVYKELENVYFIKNDAASYNNKYENAELRYYETEPYKGLPAIVPFDLEKGWYAAIKQTLPIGSNIASYEASGRVISFWVCNVGENKREENIGGDDKCEMINTNTGQDYSVFPGLGSSEAKIIIKKAKDAVEQASRIPESQRKNYVSIAGNRVKVGKPQVDIPDFQCQDFMSPKDCLLLFNLCDPVICPSSRCDLGGAYPVQDVVQSGIIGSIVLCLPNAKAGIAMPVCLTGVKAGVDGFLSIQQSYKDCLQESLDTGKMVGICDEIYSIYICDFFWKQALPFSGLIIPKIVEALLGQNVRGGGEYLGVASAWEGADKAFNYFVNYYGATSKNAFVARTTESFVDNVCKAYASAVVPSGADLIDTLTSPDSPVQFHGRFDEIPMTTATVPPTSHYKVFYHIYAGQDSGAYYQVYLKGVAESSYYRDTASNVMVASGYVSVGGYASETKDFTAVSGYKELCISVNGQVECGFKEVSTSFALNYISDEYLASQAKETDITTESGCISGSASLYSLLNLNPQSAAEDLINPEIYNQGIIRICATDNPGLGTDAAVGTNASRWKQVGTCGGGNIKCWLDTESVKDVIKTTTVEGKALDVVSDNYLTILQNEGGYLDDKGYSSAISSIDGETDSLKRIILINEVIGKVFWDEQKANLLYKRGNAYSDLLGKVAAEEPTPPASGDAGDSVGITGGTTSGNNPIWLAAKALADANWDEVRPTANRGTSSYDDNVCSRFVLHAMINAGVTSFLNSEKTGCRQSICTIKDGKMTFNSNSWSSWENIDYYITKGEDKVFKDSGDFVEISKNDWNNNLEKGDIIILGRGGQSTQHIVIFDSYSVDKKYVKVYGDAGVKCNGDWLFGTICVGSISSVPVEIETYLVIKNRWYIHRVFRYTGDYFNEEVPEASLEPNSPATDETTVTAEPAVSPEESKAATTSPAASKAPATSATPTPTTTSTPPATSIIIPSATLAQYNNYKVTFEKYASRNVPTARFAMSVNDFKALLAAMAQKNNWGGGTRGGDDWLMGFETGNVNYQGVDKQISTVSGVLRSVIEREISSPSSIYNPCISTKDLNLRCILSVLKTGKRDTGFGEWLWANTEGNNYADGVLSLWVDWKTYFNSVSGSAH